MICILSFYLLTLFCMLFCSAALANILEDAIRDNLSLQLPASQQSVFCAYRPVLKKQLLRQILTSDCSQRAHCSPSPHNCARDGP